MTEINQPSSCPNYSKLIPITNSPLEREWTRLNPMGSTIRPRLIPPTKSTSDQGNQTNIPLKEEVIVPKRPAVPRDYEINPKLKTMYHYQYNDSGDMALGFCDNRTITERNRYFKNMHRAQNDLLLKIKNGSGSGIRRYRSNYDKIISEYMAETSFIGWKILKSRIHDHTKCGNTSSRCVHFVDF